MSRIFALMMMMATAVAPFASAAQGAESPPGEDASASVVDRWISDPRTIFDSSEVDVEDFKWIARPVVVFADTPADPAYQEQIERIDRRVDDLVRRDVVVITDTDPEDMSDLRRSLRPRGFMLVLMGKDGEIELRKPFPWDAREIGRSIDKMPMRLREMRERRGQDG